MLNSPDQRLLEALLDSWDRNNTILVNLLQPALREGAEQVDQDGVIPVPGIQQSFEQALVW